MLPRIQAAVEALRPREWIKNLFVTAPLIFTRGFLEAHRVQRTAAIFVLFCVAASVVYLVNDTADAESDRKNPLKEGRPVASGRMSLLAAWILSISLEVIVLAGFAFVGKAVFVVLAYQSINLCYAFFLKHIPVIDLFCVASGFVFRVLAGAMVIDVPLSSWMLNTTLCLALYLATIKRRQEIIAIGSKARAVLDLYSVDLLDYYAFFAGIMAVVFYGMFVLTVRPALETTLPLVIFGFFRYRFLVVTKNSGESPTELVLKDWPLSLTVVGWGVLCVVAMARQV